MPDQHLVSTTATSNHDRAITHKDTMELHPPNTSASNSANGNSNVTKRTSIAAGTPTLSKTETVLCGAAAGVVSRFVIAPLDVVKIRLQMQTQRKELSTILKIKAGATGDASAIGSIAKQQPKYRGMFSGMATIVREEGIRGLWKGNMAAEYLYLTYSGIQFLVYQQSKVLLNRTAELTAQRALTVRSVGAGTTPTSGSVLAAPLSAISVMTNSSAVQSFIAGANAGIVATACTYPFDLLRTRFAVQRDVKVYTGIVQACRHIYRADGIQGFYRGMSPALIQVIPYMGIMFGTYDSLKRIASWLKYKDNVESSYSKRITTVSATPVSTETSTTTSGSVQLTSPSSLPRADQEVKMRLVKTVGQFLLGLEDLLCGALSGVISKTGVYPLDMVRKRLQIQGSEQQKVTANAYSPSGLLGSKPATRHKLPTTVWKCMLHIARTEGYLALYKGLLPGLVKAAPASAVTFLVFSQAGTFVEKFRGRTSTPT